MPDLFGYKVNFVLLLFACEEIAQNFLVCYGYGIGCEIQIPAIFQILKGVDECRTLHAKHCVEVFLLAFDDNVFAVSVCQRSDPKGKPLGDAARGEG